jgi:CubicO group peptidase (beta-lactamase class C family)
MRGSKTLSFILTSAIIVWIAVPAAAAQEEVPSAEVQRLSRTLVPEIHRVMTEGRIPSCTIALVRDDKIVWTGAYGFSNVWAKTPARIETVYLIGSTFKTMSAFGLLQLMVQA